MWPSCASRKPRALPLAVLCCLLTACPRIHFASDDSSVSDGGRDGNITGTADGAVNDASDADASCVSIPETCNGLDDDCDGAVDDVSPTECLTTPSGDFVTIAETTFDASNAPSTLRVLEGALEADSPAAVFANGLPDFKVTRSLGWLAMLPSATVGQTHAVTFPEVGADAVQPNQVRTTIELTFGGDRLLNGPGPDLAVYETGDPEPYAVSFVLSDGTVTQARYLRPQARDATNDVYVTRFELDDFDVGERTVQAVRIRNVFTAEAAEGEDRVDSSTGQGRLLYPTDAGYANGFPLTDAADQPWGTASLGADIVWVVGIHQVARPDCCNP